MTFPNAFNIANILVSLSVSGECDSFSIGSSRSNPLSVSSSQLGGSKASLTTGQLSMTESGHFNDFDTGDADGLSDQSSMTGSEYYSIVIVSVISHV